MKKQTRLLLCFLTILLALGLSACSGNGENPAESTGADSRPEESTAGTTDNKTEKPGDDSGEGTTCSETSGAETGGEETTEQDPLSDVMKRLLSDDERLTPFDRDRVKTTVNVVDKGVKANDVSAADRNLTLINRLISSAGEYTEIYFPAGTYYIAPTRLSGGIRLEGKKNILLRGENATLVNTSYSSRNGKNTAFYNTGNLLRTYGCENVTVEGLTLDYLVHTTAEGTVEKIEGGYTYIRLYGDWYTAEGKTPLRRGASLLRQSDRGGRHSHERMVSGHEQRHSLGKAGGHAVPHQRLLRQKGRPDQRPAGLFLLRAGNASV